MVISNTMLPMSTEAPPNWLKFCLQAAANQKETLLNSLKWRERSQRGLTPFPPNEASLMKPHSKSHHEYKEDLDI